MRQHAAWSILAAGACLLSTAHASASDFSLHQSIQWPWLIDQGARYFAQHVAIDASLPPRPEILAVPRDAPVVGTSIGAALLVGNCGDTTSLLGSDQRSAVDFANVRRSSRILLERLTLGGGRIQPFFQVGIGQWHKDVERRIDGDVWYGVQYGAGLQMRASDKLALAIEADQAYVRLGSFDLRGDFRGIVSSFLGVRIGLP
jgi:hypothetical protein